MRDSLTDAACSIVILTAERGISVAGRGISVDVVDILLSNYRTSINTSQLVIKVQVRLIEI